MSLVSPLLVISALVWLAMTAAMLWLAWKLWMANKTAESNLEPTNVSKVEQVPRKDELTDYRRATKQNRHVDEVALMRNWRPIAPFRGRWDECAEDAHPVGDYPIARAKVAGRRSACETVVDETGEANVIGGWNV